MTTIEKLDELLEAEDTKIVALLNVLQIMRSGLDLVATIALMRELTSKVILTAPTEEYKEYIRTKMLEALTPK